MVLVAQLRYSICLFHLQAAAPGEVYFASQQRAEIVISGLLLTGICLVHLCRGADCRASPPPAGECEVGSRLPGRPGLERTRAGGTGFTAR